MIKDFAEKALQAANITKFREEFGLHSKLYKSALMGEWMDESLERDEQWAIRDRIDNLTEHIAACRVLYMPMHEIKLIWPHLPFEAREYLFRTVVGIPLYVTDDPAEACVTVGGNVSHTTEPVENIPFLAEVDCSRIDADIFPLPTKGVFNFYKEGEAVHPYVYGENFAVTYTAKGEPVTVTDSAQTDTLYRTAPVTIPKEVMQYIEKCVEDFFAEKDPYGTDRTLGEFLRSQIDFHDELSDDDPIAIWLDTIPTSVQLFGVSWSQQCDPRHELFREVGDAYGIEYPKEMKALGELFVKLGIAKDETDWNIDHSRQIAYLLNQKYAGGCIPLFHLQADWDESLAFIVPHVSYTEACFAPTECIGQGT